ncbi:MAG: hypothetical protein GXP54_11060, partial [Deltaproteobacteria bacterium]|nr:hypothetical protein [Deltaproteobacteria bacterium]
MVYWNRFKFGVLFAIVALPAVSCGPAPDESELNVVAGPLTSGAEVLFTVEGNGIVD